jgi:predicted metal-binding protein
MSETAMTIFVCSSCKSGHDGADRPGAQLIETLSARLEAPASGIALRSVDCLAVCKRPATISFVAPGKWTYVIGDIDVETHIDDVIAAARAYAESETGVVAWKQRPAFFRKGVIARVPPL